MHVVTSVLQSASEFPFTPQSFYEFTVDKACTYVFPGIGFHQVSISADGGGGGGGPV
jgi:hypothetical protein